VRFFAAAVLFTPIITAACSSSDDANDNTIISGLVVLSGNGQTGVIGLGLAAPLVVKVTDTNGDPMAGVAITFTTSSGGTLSATSATTDANGDAQTYYTLGLVSGAQTVTASAAGLSTPVTFTVSAAVATNPGIAIVSGNNQTVAAGTQLPLPLIIKVTDNGGTPLPGMVVTWSSAAGVLGNTSTTTGANGQAQISFTMPAGAGASIITATVSGTSTNVMFTETGT
jgi:hypothetical protein